jgi:hypothetical protein
VRVSWAFHPPYFASELTHSLVLVFLMCWRPIFVPTSSRSIPSANLRDLRRRNLSSSCGTGHWPRCCGSQCYSRWSHWLSTAAVRLLQTRPNLRRWFERYLGGLNWEVHHSGYQHRGNMSGSQSGFLRLVLGDLAPTVRCCHRQEAESPTARFQVFVEVGEVVCDYSGCSCLCQSQRLPLPLRAWQVPMRTWYPTARHHCSRVP